VKNNKKTRRGPGFVPMLVLFVLIAVMAVELIQMSSKLSSARNEQSSIAAQVQQRRQENESLKSDLSHADDEDFIKDLAREQLGLAETGERIFYDVND
jgi:cell division protein FtsL